MNNDSGANNVIGGTTAAARNVISGNTTHGVIVTQGASSNAIRDNLAIAYNGGNGITVISGTENLILRNSIFSNGGLGIDLGGDGVTLNDTGDGDPGANNLQNFPVLTSAVTNGANTTIQGTINSTAQSQLLLNFFANPSCDVSGYGEGKTYLGATQVTTDSSGNATFNSTFSVSIPAGQVITATAMTSSGSASEFSTCLAISSNCTYTLTPAGQSFSAQGGSSSFNVTVSAGCAWMATSNAAWITITSGGSGSGNGTVNYSVGQNINVNSHTGKSPSLVRRSPSHRLASPRSA